MAEKHLNKIAQMINPEVLAPMLEQKFIDNIVFAPLAEIDRTLVGRPGDTITFPKWAYIGDAEVVGEGDDIPLRELGSDKVTKTVRKAGNGVWLSDETLLSAYGDPANEVFKQLYTSMANLADKELLAELKALPAGRTIELAKPLSYKGVAFALTLFGEDLDGTNVMVISPMQLATLRTSEQFVNATDVGANMQTKGAVGRIWGVELIVSNRIVEEDGEFENYIVRPGALKLMLKRDTAVETDRDIINKTNYIVIDKHYVPYLYNEANAIKIVSPGLADNDEVVVPEP